MIEKFLKFIDKNDTLNNDVEGISLYCRDYIIKDGKDYVFSRQHARNNFETLYALINRTVQYKATFTQEQMRAICFDVLSLFFDYKIFGFSNNLKKNHQNPTDMSEQFSSFWYKNPCCMLTIPVTVRHKYYLNQHPMSFQYDFRFNEKYVYLQNHLKFDCVVDDDPDDCPETTLANSSRRIFDISFKKIDNTYSYKINIKHLKYQKDKEKITTEFKKTGRFKNFSLFQEGLKATLSEFFYNAYYKEKCTQLMGTPLAFEDFVLNDVDSIVEMFDF